MFGIDPQKLAAVQEVSKHISAVITLDYKEESVHLVFSSDDPGGKQLIPDLVSQFGEALASQLSSFFAITGKVIEVGKGGEEPSE